MFLYIEYLANTWILVWKTENQVRSIIINKIFEYGGTWESFDSIVAFWKNSSIPHHKTWNTIIWNGPLMIDIWAIYNWYCSDFTRTIWVWERNEEYADFKKIYEIVKEAHMEAFEKFKVGMTWKDLDKIARDSISKNWFWEYFTHSLWHWVWLDIHENPRINSNSTDILVEWMCFTIEPWIYLDNKFWVRLEDIVYVENSLLKKYTKVIL